ncbi:MAG: type II and III secretion system protein family protein [Dongiaceae bacterium]
MRIVPTIAGSAIALLILVNAPAPLQSAMAQETKRVASGQTITVPVSQGQLIRIDRPVTSVFVANSEIADVAVKSQQLIYVFAKRQGTTTIYATDDSDEILASITLQVSHNLSGLSGALAQLLPGRNVAVQTYDGGIMLQGVVGSNIEAEDAHRLASKYVGAEEEVINKLQVSAPNQVHLRVRVAEVSRNDLQQIGINWGALVEVGDFAFGLFTAFPGAILGPLVGGSEAGGNVSTGSLDITATIDMLSEEGLISLLAEPNLTALSGETASFLAGGEFPIPVDQGDNSVTIEYKQFGVSLAFTPTILNDNRISLRVRPEVSALSDQNAFQGEDFVAPALVTRRAETTIELASGQTFAIAGLMTANDRLAANDVPGFSEIPILGELFKSDRFQRSETELVILATAYVVQPISNPNLPAVPTDLTTGTEGSQRLSQTQGIATSSGISGQAGFVIE